jgi:phage shock protein PspC (stress-responsive transcriptional regulator)
MVDMNDTSFDPGTAPGPAPQAPQQPHHDLDRLRRSVSDRYVAGVAGGLGRHFNIDPTIVRVLLAVLTLFGGAGVLIYAVCWAFVPEEGHERAVFNIGSDARKILLLAAAGIAVLIAMGDAFSGFNAGWPIASIAVVIGVVLIARDRRAERRNPTPPAPAYPANPATWQAPAPGAPAPYGAPVTAQPAAPYADTAVQPTAPPAWQPPIARPPLVGPHPKRTGILWFWPTLAMIAIGLGLVGIVDAGHHVDAGVYPAVAVAITGVVLVLGSFFGRSGGLILVGLISTAVLAMAAVVGTFHLDGRDLQSDPRTAAEVQPHYSTHVGRIRLDLTHVADPAALAGRTLHLDLKAGEVTVIVPRSLNVDIDAQLGFAGGIRIPGYDGGGVQDKAERHLTATPASTSAPLVLDLDVRVGQITVEQR